MSDWRDDAACKDVPTNYFFEDAWTGTGRAPGFHAAEAICLECPVRPDCLAWAITLTDYDTQGVFGGLDPRGLRAARKAAAILIAGPTGQQPDAGV